VGHIRCFHEESRDFKADEESGSTEMETKPKDPWPMDVCVLEVSATTQQLDVF
jgi:hypothetical protein